MTTSVPQLPTIHVSIDHDFDKRLKKAIPRGMRSLVIRILVETLVGEIERNGPGILGILLSKRFDLRGLVENVQILNKGE